MSTPVNNALGPLAPVEESLESLAEMLESARALPMSASCVVHRAEALERVDEVRAALPPALAEAESVLRERDALLADARAQADELLATGRAEQEQLVSTTSVFARAQAEADRILEAARTEADAMRAQTEQYVDGKLAAFEVVLTTTLETVERGRGRLGQPGASDLGPLGQAPLVEADLEDDAPVP